MVFIFKKLFNIEKEIHWSGLIDLQWDTGASQENITVLLEQGSKTPRISWDKQVELQRSTGWIT